MKAKITKPCTIVAAVLTITMGFIFLFAQKTPAQGTELVVVVSDGMKPSVEELVPQMEHTIGRKLTVQYNSSKNIREKIQSGEPFDVAILTTDIIDDLIKQGKIAAGSRTEIARTGMGVGVRAGAVKPDVSTPDALKRALVNAKSISFNPSGASAPHIYNIFEHLGIADSMKPKLMLDPEAGRPQMNVADGKADLVITLIPEIKFFKGVELAGPIPADLQSYISFGAGVASNAKNADTSKALIKFITSPAAAPVLKSKALEPR
ncbi:MAG: molybdate transporter, periplasmic molybdate-binding protein [Candidatus Acidoferrum typicum]|nr:molybdate transporter, periplasmic molybdate-binding protein [Candidatus Acidoferrum typicum]